MDRKITDVFLEWKNGPKGKALLVKGCRQVGKTYSLKDFAEKNYKNTVYINFETDPSYRSLFSDNTTADSLCEKLGFTTFSEKLVPGETIVIFDEIQACPGAFSALKPLAEDGRFDYAASGSLLGTELSDGFLSPLGYVKTVEMFPMDFEEYLWANGINRKSTENIRRHVKNREPFDGFVFSKLREHFMRFMVIGGMPEAVDTYVKTKDYSKTVSVFKDITEMLYRDASNYSPIADRLRIKTCYDSIPEQIGKENNTFSYFDIEKMRGAGSDRYGAAIDWITVSGLAYKINNLIEPREPLRRNVKERSFKIYLNDTGLLTYLTGTDIAGGIVNGDSGINNGAVTENAVAVMLKTLGHRIYFFQKSNSTLEIDFILNCGSAVTAIEVKSGRYDYPKSLITVMSEKYGVKNGILLANENISVDKYGVLHLPLFAVAFFDGPEVSVLPPVEDPDGLNGSLER